MPGAVILRAEPPRVSAAPEVANPPVNLATPECWNNGPELVTPPVKVSNFDNDTVLVIVVAPEIVFVPLSVFVPANVTALPLLAVMVPPLASVHTFPPWDPYHSVVFCAQARIGA